MPLMGGGISIFIYSIKPMICLSITWTKKDFPLLYTLLEVFFKIFNTKIAVEIK